MAMGTSGTTATSTTAALEGDVVGILVSITGTDIA